MVNNVNNNRVNNNIEVNNNRENSHIEVNNNRVNNLKEVNKELMKVMAMEEKDRIFFKNVKDRFNKKDMKYIERERFKKKTKEKKEVLKKLSTMVVLVF